MAQVRGVNGSWLMNGKCWGNVEDNVVSNGPYVIINICGDKIHDQFLAVVDGVK